MLNLTMASFLKWMGQFGVIAQNGCSLLVYHAKDVKAGLDSEGLNSLWMVRSASAMKSVCQLKVRRLLECGLEQPGSSQR